VRVQFHLENTSDKSIDVPRDLGIKAGNVRGSVIDPAGDVRTFSAVVWRLDDDQFKKLEKKSHDDTYSTTLLRGPEGALFRVPGPHRIRLVVRWDNGTSAVSLSGEATVTVTPPVDEDHRLSALIVLATPETLLSLVIGGDHLVRGNAAVDAAIKNPVLKPHFALIEAKRLARGYRPCKKESATVIKWEDANARGPRLGEALALIQENTVLAPDEIRKVALLIDQGLRSAAGYAKGEPGKMEELAEVGLAPSPQAVARLALMLKERVDRLIAYGILRSGDKTVKAVGALPQSEDDVVKKFVDYVLKQRDKAGSRT
jgi:hypothetical protein